MFCSIAGSIAETGAGLLAHPLPQVVRTRQLISNLLNLKEWRILHKEAHSSMPTKHRSTSGKKSSSRGRKGSRRKYSPSAGSDVKREMHEFKRGKLKSGRSGKKVKSRKQAIAIGLSEARRKGKKVPSKKSSSSSHRKAA
jgi:Family of unknown function (DUF6496)